MSRLMKHLADELKKTGTPARAEQEKKYLKSELKHYGVRVPEMRKILKKHAQGITLEDVEWLWTQGVYELRAAAVEALVLAPDLLAKKDAKLIERYIREANTWALVDTLAPTVMGHLLEKYPELEKTTDKWAKHDDFWLRRAALLVHLLPLRKGVGNFDRFNRYAESMLHDKEFFVRKAMGWVLRETAKKRPQLVKDWLKAHECSGLTRREASKNLK